MTKDEFLRSLWSEEDKALVTFDFHGALQASYAHRLAERGDLLMAPRKVTGIDGRIICVEMTEWADERLDYLRHLDVLDTYNGPDFIIDPVSEFGFQRLVFSQGRIEEFIAEGLKTELLRMTMYPKRPLADLLRQAS